MAENKVTCCEGPIEAIVILKLFVLWHLFFKGSRRKNARHKQCHEIDKQWEIQCNIITLYLHYLAVQDCRLTDNSRRLEKQGKALRLFLAV